jgi:hypothetical protein
VDPSRAISCALFDDEAPKTTLWFHSLPWFRLLWEKTKISVLACSLCFFSLRRFASSWVAMAPLKAVAVLVGTAGVSGVVHFQQEGEGYGFFPFWLLFFFSFLPCRHYALFCLLPNWRKGFQKAFLSVGDVYQF